MQADYSWSCLKKIQNNLILVILNCILSEMHPVKREKNWLPWIQRMGFIHYAFEYNQLALNSIRLIGKLPQAKQ